MTQNSKLFRVVANSVVAVATVLAFVAPSTALARRHHDEGGVRIEVGGKFGDASVSTCDEYGCTEHRTIMGSGETYNLHTEAERFGPYNPWGRPRRGVIVNQSLEVTPNPQYQAPYTPDSSPQSERLRREQLYKNQLNNNR